MNNIILCLSLALNLVLSVMLFCAKQYTSKVVSLNNAMSVKAQLHQNEQLLSYIDSRQTDKARNMLADLIDGERLAFKTWADNASQLQLPFTPREIREMEEQLALVRTD